MAAPNPASLKADRALLLDTVTAASELAHDLFKRGVKSWKKEDQTPLTEADIAVDTLLRERLCAARPEYGWLSEETKDDSCRMDCTRVWIVDPIDGTKGFVKGNDQWCISAALVERGKPLLGVIVNPCTAETFVATSGGGAFRNDIKLQSNQREDVNGCTLVMHHSIVKSKRWAKPWPKINLSMWNSMALRLCRVATGEADGAIVISGKSDWDLAAADLIVQEAGGSVTDLNGARMRYNEAETVHRGIVGADRKFHRQLLTHTKGWKPRD